MEGRGEKKKLTAGGAQGSTSRVAMPNLLIKWTKRNTHSDPPPPLGAEKVAATSPDSHPHGKGGGKVSLFTRQMPDISSLPFKLYSPAHSPYEEFWNSEHLYVYQMFPTALLKDWVQVVQQR